jgi:hypothetical protein
MTLYAQLLDVSQEYLGPAAERFLLRQIENHLHKDPQQLTKEDVTKVAEWMQVSVSVLTEDEKTVDEFIKKVNALAA